MSKYPTLQNAPISEAVIEFRFSPNTVSFQTIKSFCESLKSKYPNQKSRFLKEIKFAVGGEDLPVPEQKNLGPELMVVSSEDEKKIFQIAKDKFSFSRVGEYSTWDGFSSEALRVWSGFLKSAKIKFVMRIGVRFINNLNLPREMESFADFLKNAPTVPDGIPKTSTGFLTRLMLAPNDTGASAIISQALDPNREKVSGSRLPVILDIDVYKTGKLESSGENFMKILSNLRNYKNDIFFNSVQPKTLELYQ